MTTDTPRTEALPSDLEGINNDLVIRALRIFGREKMTKDGSLESWINLGADRLEKAKAEVEGLKELVKLSARKGDELLEPYRLRAEKAETLLKQIQAFVETLNPTDK